MKVLKASSSALGSWRILGVAFVATLVAQSAVASISGLRVGSDATNATYGFNYSGSPTYLRIFIDIDKNANTGNQRFAMGADFLIENGNFYKYSGVNGAWGWTRLGSSGMTKPSAGVVNFVVPRSSLGSPVSANVVGEIESPREYTAVAVQNFSSTTTWIPCGAEYSFCAFTGTRIVRYGANGLYAYKTLTGGTNCDNSVFGDPLKGATKYCDYSSGEVTAAPSPTPTPVATPLPSPTPVVTPVSGTVSQISYSANPAQIPNPERGFYRPVECVNSTLSVSTMNTWRANDTTTVVLCNGSLAAFKTSPISADALNRIQANFDVFRASGMKVVLRFKYTDNATLGDDATPAQVSAHLDQLAPILQRNADVIATMQAGFVGAWGEWDSSANFGFWYNRTAQNWADRKALTDKILSILPPTRTVSHHMVYDKQKLYGITAPLMSSEAYQNTAKARIGYHDDCFLASDSDMGTYTNKATEFPFISEDAKYLPMGGETCKLNAPRSSCATAQSELSALHWSYLNLSYNTTVLDSWRAEGCFENVKAKLGYRFVLKTGAYSSGANVGGQISVAMNIVNEGYASPFNPRGLELILRNTISGAVFRLPMNSDPRRWLPGSTIAVQQTLTLPASLPAGDYDLLLNLPDPTPTLYSKPIFSIQLANAGTWESSTGFNRLNQRIHVSP